MEKRKAIVPKLGIAGALSVLVLAWAASAAGAPQSPHVPAMTGEQFVRDMRPPARQRSGVDPPQAGDGLYGWCNGRNGWRAVVPARSSISQHSSDRDQEPGAFTRSRSCAFTSSVIR